MRLMDKAFGNLTFQTLLVYLDDILVFGDDAVLVVKAKPESET